MRTLKAKAAEEKSKATADNGCNCCGVLGRSHLILAAVAPPPRLRLPALAEED